VLGAGMVINLEALRDELINLEKICPQIAQRIIIDPDAFIVSAGHIYLDKKTNSHIGTTNKGIGPAYLEKVARNGVKVRELVEGKSDITEALKKMGVTFKYALEMYNELKCSEVLFEGAQGILLDLNAGTYPYVSCGDSTLAGIYSSGFGFIAPQKVYGVAKAYATKVGEGPFPTEYFDEEAEKLRKLGNEYGAVSGRPRRVGALDLPALRYAIKRGGLTHLIMTKFDILNGWQQDNFVKVCTKYDKEPVSGGDFFTTKPEYTFLPFWNDASDDEQIRPFIEFVEKETQLRVEYVSSGVGENDIRKWY
jgi:adenylosuccinate synthase